MADEVEKNGGGRRWRRTMRLELDADASTRVLYDLGFKVKRLDRKTECADI